MEQKTVHGRPHLIRLSFIDYSQEEVAPVHPDFCCDTMAAVHNGFCWIAPNRFIAIKVLGVSGGAETVEIGRFQNRRHKSCCLLGGQGSNHLFGVNLTAWNPLGDLVTGIRLLLECGRTRRQT